MTAIYCPQGRRKIVASNPVSRKRKAPEQVNGDTADRILDAAERLFAERGYSAVSTRTITEAAGVNTAALHYHFGSKEAVLDAVFKRRLSSINRKREDLLDACDTPGLDAGRIEEIITAFIGPTLELGGTEGERNFKLLAGRASTDPNPEVKAVLFDVYDSVARHFLDVLGKARPDISRRELFWRVACVYGAMMYIRADNGRLRHIFGEDFSLANTEEAFRYAIPFLTAGMNMPAVDANNDATSS